MMNQSKMVSVEYSLTIMCKMCFRNILFWINYTYIIYVITFILPIDFDFDSTLLNILWKIKYLYY